MYLFQIGYKWNGFSWLLNSSFCFGFGFVSNRGVGLLRMSVLVASVDKESLRLVVESFQS